MANAQTLVLLRQPCVRHPEARHLIAWNDLSYDEAAAALDIPVGTVRSRISRARLRLRTRLAELGYTGA